MVKADTMKETIVDFMKRQTCATICCTDEAGIPYCFSCYYVFDDEKAFLFFKSSIDALHTSLLTNNPAVAGTVLPDKLNKLIAKGVQFRGKVMHDVNRFTKDAYMKYHAKYPMALVVRGDIFIIKISSIKMTDSGLGSGKKIMWKRDT